MNQTQTVFFVEGTGDRGGDLRSGIPGSTRLSTPRHSQTTFDFRLSRQDIQTMMPPVCHELPQREGDAPEMPA